MRKIWIVIGMSLFLSLGAQAQDLKLKVNDKGKVGFVDLSGNEVVACQYESAAPFEDGVSIVSKSKKYGLVNSQGTVLAKPQYDEITPWGNHTFLIKKGKKYGIIASDGSVKLAAKYTCISRLNHYGKAWVSQGGKVVSVNGKQMVQGGKYGIVNSDGSIAVEAKYKGLFEFALPATGVKAMHEGMRPLYRAHALGDTLLTDGQYFAVTKKETSSLEAGVISGTDKLLMPMGKASIVMRPQSDMVRCYVIKSRKTICMYYNIESGQLLTVSEISDHIDNLSTWTHSDFNGDIAAVNTSEGWKFIDKQNNTIKAGYSTIMHSSNAKAWAGVKQGESECDAFDENGKPLFAEGVKIEGIEFSENTSHTDIFGVRMNGKWGAINRQGQVVLPFVYDRVKAPMYNYIPVMTSDGWGLRSLDDKEVMPCQFVDMKVLTEENPRIVWGEKSDKLWYAYDLVQRQLRPEGYEQVLNYQDGYAWVRAKGTVVPDNPTTRAMVKNVTGQEATDELFNSAIPYFGSLLGLDGSVYAEGPYNVALLPQLIKLMHAYGDKKLTKSQNKKMSLYITRDQRTYPMQTKIDDADWDF